MLLTAFLDMMLLCSVLHPLSWIIMFTEECSNLESDLVCQFYSNIGQCEDNSVWMMEFCKLTCGFCDDDKGGRTTLAPHGE